MLYGLFSQLCFFFKQKTAYEVRISDWSSDVCSSDLSCSTTNTLTLSQRRRYSVVGSMRATEARWISGTSRRYPGLAALGAQRSARNSAARSPRSPHRPQHVELGASRVRVEAVLDEPASQGHALAVGDDARQDRSWSRSSKTSNGDSRSPRQASTPSRIASTATTRAATESAHARSEEPTSELQSLMRN